ncbi:aminopeptidase [Escherichia coli]
MTNPQFAGHPFGTTVTAETLRNTFAPLTQWEDKYRQLIMLGKQLPALPEELKAQAKEIAGCENRVWLGYTVAENGKMHFFGDSEGRIVRGLLAVLLTAVEGKTAAELQAQSPLALFDELGLRAQLSASRSQGLNALELAERLKNTPTEYGIRFVATSGEEEGKLGAENLLKRMSDTEKKNTLLVINLDNLIVGDKLYFNSGVKTPEAVRKLTRDRALAIARSHGIAATTNPGLNKNYPKGTGCCNDAEIFDKAGIAVLSVEATNWNLGNKDGYQQRAKTAAFPAGNSWHDVRLDNQQHIDKALPGRIERRCRDVMRIMLPLVKELAKAS